MSGRYTLRNTKARQVAKEMVRLKVERPAMTERHTEANTGIRNIYLKHLQTDTTREEIEEADVATQCLNVLKPPIDGRTTCWLCGFLVSKMSITPMPSNYFGSSFMDEVVCEHVLPVRLASVMTGLYTEKGGYSGIGDEHLLHSVYEYAHVLCNLAKSNMWFISKPDKTTQNFCDLKVNEEKIKYFLDYLLNYQRSPIGRRPFLPFELDGILRVLIVDRHESRIFYVENNEPHVAFPNLVQYYIFQEFSAPDRSWEDMKKMWKENQFLIIKAKTERLIEKIKAADGCFSGAAGGLYSATMDALRQLEIYGAIPRMIGPSLPIFARSPSIESIRRRASTSGRLHPTLLPTVFEKRRQPLITELNAYHFLGIEPPKQNIVKLARSGKTIRKMYRSSKKKRGRKTKGKGR